LFLAAVACLLAGMVMVGARPEAVLPPDQPPPGVVVTVETAFRPTPTSEPTPRPAGFQIVSPAPDPLTREPASEHRAGRLGNVRREESSMVLDHERDALAWQLDVWNRMAEVYPREIDHRFVPVVDAVLARAALRPGELVLDVGSGTGAVAERAADAVGPTGRVVGIDISPAMVAVATQRARELGLANIRYAEARAESLPVADATCDAVLASLSIMYVVDRAAAAREVARVLRPGGRLVAAVWAGQERCDIVRFQQTAGAFAPPPPVPGVGPGALADSGSFLTQLAEVGIDARVEAEDLGFDFESFDAAWDALAHVTAAQLDPARRDAAKAAVLNALYPDGDGPRLFRNETQFVVGTRNATQVARR
jgi:SAM-dependent methyltransferase